VQRPGLATDCFIEGPVFDSDGNLFVVDIPYGRVFRIDPQGNVELFVDYDGEPNGLAVTSDGRLLVADHRRGLLSIDPANRQVSCLLERDTMDHFKGLNDLVVASNGDVYFTDQGGTGWHDPTGRVYRFRADGTLDRLLDNVPSPNGLALAPDEKTLYLAVTRANAVWRVPLPSTGGAFKVGTFIQLTGGVGPDGLAMDPDGNLVVAHYGMGCAWIFDPRGLPLYCVCSCEGLGITNVAFGPGEVRSLFMTDSETGTVLRASLPDVLGPKVRD
jgi:gluconolactonase